MADHNTLTHKFISTKAQNPDSSITSKNEWNSEHTFSGGVNGQVLTFDNSKTDNVLWVDKPIGTNVSVVDSVVSGTGTLTDPYLGWEAAFSAVTSTTYTAIEYHNYVFSQGWYSTPRTLIMKRYTGINGNGEGTVIQYTGSIVGIEIAGIGTPSDTFDVYRCSLSNFQLVGTGGYVGINMTNVFDINMHQVNVHGGLPLASAINGYNQGSSGWSAAGVFVGASGSSACFLIRMNQCRIQNCAGTGLLIGNTSTFPSSLITTVSCVGCRIQGNQGYGVYTEKYMACLTFESCDIEGNAFGDIWADIVNGVSVINCYFENTTVPHIAIGSGTGGNGGGVFINGCFFNHHLGGNAIAIGASGNEVRGVSITGNYFIAQDSSAAAIKLGRIVMGQFCPNYVPSGKIMFDFTTANLIGCEVQDITATDPFVKTFITTAVAEVLALKNYTNVSGATTALHFKTLARTRAIINSRISNTTGNEAALDFTVGTGTTSGADTFRAAMSLDASVTGGDTAMLLWDVTAGSLKRVTVDGSRFLKLA